MLGTAEECARLLEELRASGREPADVAREVHADSGRIPGFGHPIHRPHDPRAERILVLADERGVSGPHVELARRLRDAVGEAWGKPLTMNVSMPIAAVMLDLDFPTPAVKAVPILARTASLLAHLAEERERPIGLLLSARAEEAIEYEPPPDA
jgi:citrate synthase